MSRRNRNRTGAFQKAHVKDTLNRFSERQQAYAFRAGLQKSLLEARTKRQGRSIDQYFNETEALVRVERVKASRQDIGFDYLTQLIEAEELSLADELRWLGRRLRFFSAELAKHIQLTYWIEQALLSGQTSNALTLVNDHELALGVSLWSLSLDLILIEWSLGPDELRQFMLEIRRRYPKAILPFFTTYASQRAEPTVSVGWFSENLHSRLLARSKRDSFVYLEHKLTGTIPSTTEWLASYLRVEQNHNEVDVYESTIRVLQHLAVTPDIARGTDMRDAIQSVLVDLADFPDFRVAKLRAVFGLSPNLQCLSTADGNSLDLALSGQAGTAMRVSRRRLRKHEGDIADLICLGSLTRPRRSGKAPKHPLDLLLSGKSIAPTMLRLGRGANDFDEARKTGLVLSSLPIGAQLLGLSNSFAYDSVEQMPHRLAAVALNSRSVGPLDQLLGVPAVERLHPLGKGTVSEHLFSSLVTSVDPALLEGAHRDVISTSIALRSLVHDNPAQALAHAGTEPSPSRANVLASLNTSIRIAALSKLGEIGQASHLLSIDNLVHHRLLEEAALVRTFSDRSWDDLHPFAGEIGTSLGLMLFADSVKDEKYQSYRRFALEECLAANGVDRPSRLTNPSGGQEQIAFQVFLHSACTTAVIDMLSSIESSRGVLEERRAICVLLRTIDPARASVYDEEVIAITQELTIREGMQVFDGSRVHVDRPGVKSVAKRELAESYSRYLSLSEIGSEDKGSFSAFIREYMGSEIPEKYLLAIPENEADFVLVSIAQRLREIFLLNVPSGLDSFLSKRVRHGSIVGHIRGPVEVEGLLLQRSSDGKYAPSPKTLASAPRLAEVAGSAFADFSRAFDDHLLRLKDVILHVKGDSYPLGVFDSPVNVGTFRTFKVLADGAPDFDSFLESAIAALWSQLNPSLESARNFLERETKPFLVERLNVLRSQLLEVANSPAERLLIDETIGRAATGVQSKIDAAKSWFQPQESIDRSYSFSDAISIGMAAVKAVRSEFNPAVQVEIDEERQITAGELPTFLDILYASLGNVADHSHLEQPAVRIAVRADKGASCVSIDVENDVLDEGQLEDLQSEIAETLQKIALEEESEKVRTEGKSGIRKLASIAARSRGGGFSAEATPGIRFRVSIDMAVSCLKATSTTR